MIKKIFSIFKESHESFEGQEPNERVLLAVRRHAYTILLPITFIAFLAAGPVLAWSIFYDNFSAHGLVAVFIFATSVWYLCLWLATFYSLTIYLLNTMVVTDERIIDNHQIGFFDRKVSELHLHRVQDVSIHTVGVVETVLHFGDLVVQTAASEREFIFINIPDPDRVKDVIMQAIADKERRSKAAQSQEL